MKFEIYGYYQDLDKLRSDIEDLYARKTGNYVKISMQNRSNSKIAYMSVRGDIDVAIMESSIEFEISYCNNSSYRIV